MEISECFIIPKISNKMQFGDIILWGNLLLNAFIQLLENVNLLR